MAERPQDDVEVWQELGDEAEEPKWLRRGVRVEVAGLQGRPELNGRRGRLTARTAAGRWGVALEEGGEGVALKVGNLRRAFEHHAAGGFRVGDWVRLLGLQRLTSLNGRRGRILGAAGRSRWVVKLEGEEAKAKAKLRAFGAGHLCPVGQLCSLWFHHQARQRAVAALCQGPLADVRSRLEVFMPDTFEVALVVGYGERGHRMEATCYSLREPKRSVVTSMVMDVSESNYVLAGIRGPHWAMVPGTGPMQPCRMMWESRYDPYGSRRRWDCKISREEIMHDAARQQEMPPVFSMRSDGLDKAFIVPTGDIFAVVTSIQEGWFVRAKWRRWTEEGGRHIYMEVFEREELGLEGTLVLDSGPPPLLGDTDMKDGFVLGAYRDMLFCVLATAVHVCVVGRDLRLVPHCVLPRKRSPRFPPSPGELSVCGNTLAVIDGHSSPDEAEGCSVLFFDIGGDTVSTKPKFVIRTPGGTFIREVILAGDKVFTREQTVDPDDGAILGHPIVARSLEPPYAPLFVIQDSLAKLPEAHLVSNCNLQTNLQELAYDVQRTFFEVIRS